ncbi:MAG: O-succinylhomoserine sulfhydrylase, partial [Hyphomicrobiales bacterium]|nr:O-succinylhomoserine sulfhydrylase [Hyphomicrobiales bacterium]
MSKPPTGNRNPAELRPATRLVHGGALRSEFGEMSEAIFLTQGF